MFPLRELARPLIVLRTDNMMGFCLHKLHRGLNFMHSDEDLTRTTMLTYFITLLTPCLLLRLQLRCLMF